MVHNDSLATGIPFCCAQYSDETLAVFKSFKLDDMQASKRKMEELRASGGEHVYFAKFLTSEKVRKVVFIFYLKADLQFTCFIQP